MGGRVSGVSIRSLHGGIAGIKLGAADFGEGSRAGWTLVVARRGPYQRARASGSAGNERERNRSRGGNRQTGRRSFPLAHSVPARSRSLTLFLNKRSTTSRTYCSSLKPRVAVSGNDTRDRKCSANEAKSCTRAAAS